MSLCDVINEIDAIVVSKRMLKWKEMFLRDVANIGLNIPSYEFKWRF